MGDFTPMEEFLEEKMFTVEIDHSTPEVESYTDVYAFVTEEERDAFVDGFLDEQDEANELTEAITEELSEAIMEALSESIAANEELIERLAEAEAYERAGEI